MVSEKPDHLLILGVRHPDRKVLSRVENHVDGEIERIFHESPRGDSSKWQYFVWTLVKNPLAVVVGILRLLAYIVSNLVFASKMVLKGNAGNLTLETGGQAQGLRAAKSLSEEYDTEWESVDISVVERAKLVPFKLSLVSWFAVLALIWTVPQAFTGSASWMIASLGAFAFATTVATRVGDVRRPIRDQRMFETILESCEENSCSQVVLITGENHVQGVASNAAAHGVDYDAYWLSSTADLDS